MKKSGSRICLLTLSCFLICGVGVNAQGSGSANDAGELSRAQFDYKQYESKANNYQMEATKKLEKLNQDEAIEKTRISDLERRIKTAPKVLRGKLMAQIESYRKAETADEAQKQAVQSNLTTTYSWLHYLRSKVSTAEHNISADEEIAREQSQRAADQRARISWENNLNSLTQNQHDYGQVDNVDAYGHRYRQGNFNSYHYHAPSAYSSSVHASEGEGSASHNSASSAGHSSAGHAHH